MSCFISFISFSLLKQKIDLQQGYPSVVHQQLAQATTYLEIKEICIDEDDMNQYYERPQHGTTVGVYYQSSKFMIAAAHLKKFNKKPPKDYQACPNIDTSISPIRMSSKISKYFNITSFEHLSTGDKVVCTGMVSGTGKNFYHWTWEGRMVGATDVTADGQPWTGNEIFSADTYVVSSAQYPGSSGGVCVNLGGMFVGMAVAVKTNFPHLAYIVPAHEIIQCVRNFSLPLTLRTDDVINIVDSGGIWANSNWSGNETLEWV